MPDKKNVTINNAAVNAKWDKEKAALKKLQIHFEFQQEIMRKIRYDAADARLNPSDIVRKILNLTYSKVQRPRLGLSFSQEELVTLAARYGLSEIDEKAIKRRVMTEVNDLYKENTIDGDLE